MPVFPCVADQKRPATANGFKDATTDRRQIDVWWTEDPNYNPAACPGNLGWTVVDIDPGADIDGELPDTYEVRTPRGGRHLYYVGTLPNNTASKISDNVDTRSLTGYVLLPGACVSGQTYSVVNDTDLAPLPTWVRDRAITVDTKAAATSVTLDLPINMDRARTLLNDYIRRGEVAVSGRGGNNKTYAVAAEISNLGLSEQTVWSLLRELWNPHCIPPWDDNELGTIVGNACRYRQNGEGAWAVAPAAETFAGSTLDKLIRESADRPAQRSRFHAEDEDEQDHAPEPTWLIPELIPDLATVLWLGKKGTFKSFLCLDIALALAAGRETFGATPTRTGSVFYGAHEGRNAIKKMRRQAWRIAREVEGKIPFYVMRAPIVAWPEQCEEFREQIRVRLREPGQQKIALIVLDTVAKCMVGLDENSVKDCGIFIQFVESLRDEFECPVVCQHHIGKGERKDSRGSSAMPAGFETVLDTERADESKIVNVRARFHKDAEERQTPWTLEGKTVGRSLVFQMTDAESFTEAEQSNNPFALAKVGAALRKLDAFGWSAGVTAQVLARELVKGAERDAPEKLEADVAAAARKLRSLATDRLRGFCETRGKELLWFLPEPEEWSATESTAD